MTARDRAQLLPLHARRPRTRDDCVGGPRPCPWVSCAFHLAIDVQRNGSIRIRGNTVPIEFERPDGTTYRRGVTDRDQRPVTIPAEKRRATDGTYEADLIEAAAESVLHCAETCVLDVAGRGGLTLEEVGQAIGVTRERVRQIEGKALQKLLARIKSPEAL